jgi:hypothetical protein
MKWHSHETSYDTARRFGLIEKNTVRDVYYFKIIAGLGDKDIKERAWKHQCQAEWLWEKAKRPFYNVWPTVVDGLSKLKLDISCEAILPVVGNMPNLVNLRFTADKVSNMKLFSCLATKTLDKDGGRGLGFFCYAGEMTHDDLSDYLGKQIVANVPVYWTLGFNLEGNNTIEEKLSQLGSYLSVEEMDLMRVNVRIYLSIALMKDDPEMIESVILKKDEKLLNSDNLSELVAHARQKGVVGWNVGARVQVSPHYRKAHFGLRWTGEGKKIPKVVPIKSSIVHRNLVTEVPTGTLENS